jgi:site-specific recombinase XerD
MDLLVVQKLLGHNSSKTAVRYTHVSVKSMSQLQSSLDRIGW